MCSQEQLDDAFREQSLVPGDELRLPAPAARQYIQAARERRLAIIGIEAFLLGTKPVYYFLREPEQKQFVGDPERLFRHLVDDTPRFASDDGLIVVY